MSAPMSTAAERKIAVPAKPGKSGTPLRNFLARWAAVLVAVALWEIITRSAQNVYFPAPSEIVATGAATWFGGPAGQLGLTDTVYQDVLPSLGRLFGGWSLAVVIGVVLGVALGRSRTAMDYAGPLFDFFRSLPSPALVPVFLVLFGVGTQMQVVTIVFGTVFTVLLNTVDGARSVDPTQVRTARSFRIGRKDWLLRIVLPAAAPKIFAGLRVSLSQALILMVVSELVGASNGIGYQILYAQRKFDFPALWAGIVLLGILGYLLNTALLRVEGRALGWQPNQAGQPAKAKG